MATTLSGARTGTALANGGDASRRFAWSPDPGSLPADADRDGHSGLVEFRAGKTYRIQSSPDLAIWTTVGSDITPAANGLQTFH